MSTEQTSTSNSNDSQKERKKEIFGIPQDDVTLYVAAGALGLAGLVGVKTIWDMLNNGQIPNPFQPRQARVSYADDDLYAQREAQYAQEYQRAQQLEQQKALAEQAQAQAQQPQGDDVSSIGSNSIAASNDMSYEGFDDADDGVSYSTTVQPPRSAHAATRNTLNYNRINVG